MAKEDVHPLLRPSAADHAATLLRGLSSAVDVAAPGWGSVFGELIGSVIPNLRSERVEEYITRLGRELRALRAQVDDLIQKLGPEQIALFEDGARSAARATSHDRIARIARMVAAGMTSEEEEAARARELMALLDQLTEADLFYLDRFVPRGGLDPRPWSRGETYVQRLGEITYPLTDERLAALVEAQFKDAEAKAVKDYRPAKMINLNVLQQQTGIVEKRTKFDGRPTPELKTGKPQLTSLGYMLLLKAGLGQRTWDEVLAREGDALSKCDPLARPPPA
jgi:hypothetical protein